MNYFLDTDTCIFALKGRYPSIKTRMMKIKPELIKIPAMVKAELLLGAYKSKNSKKVRTIVEEFLLPFAVVPFDDEAAEVYAKIRGDLERSGNIIGPNDLTIAAIVYTHKGTLISHNTREFKRIKKLKVEDWVS